MLSYKFDQVYAVNVILLPSISLSADQNAAYFSFEAVASVFTFVNSVAQVTVASSLPLSLFVINN
jgi:hypothetical protein